MSKTRIFALILLALLVIGILLNPTKEQLEDAVKTKAISLVEQQLGFNDQDALKLGMNLYGNKLVQDFVEKNVVVTNYYLFSLVKIRWQSQETPIGGGAFKTIWLSPKIDEKADEIITVLKSL